MSDRSYNRNSDEDEVLNELIRACRQEEPAEGFVRPDSQVITAYLLGTAPRKQERAVRAALARSNKFRLEVLEMAQDVAALSDLDLTEYEKEMNQVRVPSLQDVLKKHAERAGKDERETLWENLQNFWSKLIQQRIPQLYAPVAVAAVVLLLVSIHFGIFATTRTWTVVSENIDKGLLVSITPRGAESMEFYPSPDKAALARIRSLLEFESGQFFLSPPEKRLKPSASFRVVQLGLLDPSDNVIQEFQAHIPFTEAESAKEVTAWALGLPPRNLYKLKMKSDTMEVKWDEDMGMYGVITFTYRDEEGYKGAAGFTFDLR